MNRNYINELRKQIYDLAEELKAEVNGEHYEIAKEAKNIMNACDEIESWLDDDPADYEATIHSIAVDLYRSGV